MIPRILPRTRPRRLILLCGLVPTIVVAALSLYRPSVFGSFESGVYDRLLRSIPSRPTSERIVIIDVDERSLASVGQWPWRRDVIGKLVERLREFGAAVVALDIVFAEHDRFEGKGGRIGGGRLCRTGHRARTVPTRRPSGPRLRDDVRWRAPRVTHVRATSRRARRRTTVGRAGR